MQDNYRQAKGRVMSKSILFIKNQVGQPDEEMPELQERDFAKAKSNRFARVAKESNCQKSHRSRT